MKLHRNPLAGSFTAARVTLAWGVVLAVLVLPRAVQAQSYLILHSFGSGTDGAYPSGLVMDKRGNLYGTTLGGGIRGAGTVFKLDRTGRETLVHNFAGGPGDSDGTCSTLIRDAAGNLYGTGGGGTHFDGTVFKVTKQHVETILHSFMGGNRDGKLPCARLVRDAAGNLYGTTLNGGKPACETGCGVVFRLDAAGKETLLYRFAGTPDGAFATTGLIRDEAGNFYGTTEEGGDLKRCELGCGTVFKLTPTGSETVLYRFPGPPDGRYPSGELIRDAAGNFYGVTNGGGSSRLWGTVFKLDRHGKETVLYSFKGGSDGGGPMGALVRDSHGNLYGTTEFGGNPACNLGCGTVFKLDRNGVKILLHTFAGAPTDGAAPIAGLVTDASGNLYGATSGGGANDGGTVFKLTP